jgi:hypothetical protein
MKSAAGSSKSHNLRSQKRNNKWCSRTDLVTFDVFKREYWSHLPQNLTKAIGVFFMPSQFTYAHFRPEAPSLAFSDFLGMATDSSL